MAAEVGGGDGGHGKKKAKKGRAKKANPRIDMTPMVDLGFLLLTFFVLTTTMSRPKSMPIVMPEKVEKDVPKEEQPPKIAESKVITLLCFGDNKLYWYRKASEEQDAETQLNRTTYAAEGIRKVIKDQRKLINDQWQTAADKDPSIVLIKLADEAMYRNMVDLLDEMAIVDQHKYMIVDITPEELDLIKAYEAAQGGGAPAAPNNQ